MTKDRRLSQKARAAIQNSQRDDTLWLSLISVWELAIVATARHLEAALVTKDGAIRKYPQVRSIW